MVPNWSQHSRAIPVSSDYPPGTSGIHDQWHLASVFSHRHLFSHRPLSIVNHLIMVQPTPPKQPLPCPCQIEAIPQSFSHLGLRLSLPASSIRLRNDQKAQFTHIKLDRQAFHSPRDDLHKMCFYSRLTTGFHSSRQGHKILVASIHYNFIYRIYGRW